MRLSSKPLALILFVILFGGIAFTTWMGWWQTETTREPAKYDEGEFAGQYDPADIRGSYTFGDVSSHFEIPIGDLRIAFRLPTDSDPATVALKDLEALYGDLSVEIGTASVRMFAAYYKGLPFEPSEETYLFAEAIEILKQQGRLSPEQIDYLEQHTAHDAEAQPVLPDPVLNTTPLVAQEATPQATQVSTPQATEHSPEERKVAGKTTFQDVLDWGVPKETIEAILETPLPPTNTVIRDYCSQKGLTFSDIKNRLQEEVDKADS